MLNPSSFFLGTVQSQAQRDRTRSKKYRQKKRHDGQIAPVNSQCCAPGEMAISKTQAHKHHNRSYERPGKQRPPKQVLPPTNPSPDPQRGRAQKQDVSRSHKHTPHKRPNAVRLVRKQKLRVSWNEEPVSGIAQVRCDKEESPECRCHDRYEICCDSHRHCDATRHQSTPRARDANRMNQSNASKNSLSA
jgi:hypothetical protein